jgi:hypothetical protein
MKERPILFSARMVRAILEGRKTQTRRVMKPQPRLTPSGLMNWKGRIIGEVPHESGDFTRYDEVTPLCPYGQPGDRLWVRETWCQKIDDGRYVYNAAGNLDPSCCWYRASDHDVRADDGDGGQKYLRDGREASPWRPSIHMPRWASRLLLEVVEVRVQRVQDISEEDAKAEGVEMSGVGYLNYLWHGHFNHGDGNRLSNAWPYQYSNYEDAADSFSSLWQLINSRRGHPWDSNPWVWAITFSVI